MNSERKKDIYFAIYMIAVIILAAIYFTVPERKTFIDFQVKWWGEFRELITYFFN
jgi:hypothetical protein